MYEETTIVTPNAQTANDPLDVQLAEIGATYPLMVYTAQANETDETEALNAAILAGLVAP